MLSAIWLPLCLNLDVLIETYIYIISILLILEIYKVSYARET